MKSLKLRASIKGQALIVVYMTVFLFLIIVASFLPRAVTERNVALRNKLDTETFYMAEGAVENALSDFADAIANYQIDLAAISYQANTTFATLNSTIVPCNITRIEDADRVLSEAGINILARNYQASATAAHPQNEEISVTVHQIVSRRLIPAYQFIAFYTEDLEILPGSTMSLSGRIHTNNDLYIDAYSGVTLTVNSQYVRSAGNIFNQRKDDGTPQAGEVSIRVTKSGSAQYEAMNNLDCDSDDWTTMSQDRWKGTVKSAVHGVTELSAPSVASIQPTGYYAANADVFIENGVLKKGGVILTEGIDYPPSTIVTDTDFHNNRENKDITMTNIDLRKLANLDGEISDITEQVYPNNLPSNGLLYATRNDAGINQPGIKLVNGERIERNGGLTLVSNQPVYIEGNYNTDVKKPASIICDAVNVLSESWNDANDTLGFASRMATSTTVNCAFISGILQSVAGGGYPAGYNGGLENYLRLHEDWSNIWLNVQGSFVSLWNSQVATGQWRIGTVNGVDYYKAPRRNFTYDTGFDNSSNLPPFTPYIVEMKRIAWWKE